MKKVSVVIVNWNGKKWLKNCLDSIENQTYNNVEIVVVDNSSDDDSVEYLKKNYPYIKIIVLEENYGYAKANLNA